MTIQELGEKYLKEKGYLLTTNNGEHLAEVEALKLFEAGAKAVVRQLFFFAGYATDEAKFAFITKTLLDFNKELNKDEDNH